jgi:hypothetical protein
MKNTLNKRTEKETSEIQNQSNPISRGWHSGIKIPLKKKKAQYLLTLALNIKR